MNVKHIIAYGIFFLFFLEEESFSLSNARVVGKGHKMGIFIWFYHCRYWSSSATKSSGKFLLLPLSKALFIFRYLSIESEEKCCARIIILFLISTFSLGSFQIYAIYCAIFRRLVIPFNKRGISLDNGRHFISFYTLTYCRCIIFPY